MQGLVIRNVFEAAPELKALCEDIYKICQEQKTAKDKTMDIERSLSRHAPVTALPAQSLFFTTEKWTAPKVKQSTPHMWNFHGLSKYPQAWKFISVIVFFIFMIYCFRCCHLIYCLLTCCKLYSAILSLILQLQ
jgi:hypothetical protein